MFFIYSCEVSWALLNRFHMVWRYCYIWLHSDFKKFAWTLLIANLNFASHSSSLVRLKSLDLNENTWLASLTWFGKITSCSSKRACCGLGCILMVRKKFMACINLQNQDQRQVGSMMPLRYDQFTDGIEQRCYTKRWGSL